jgi:hypothetical protein
MKGRKEKAPNFGSMPPFTLSVPRCPKCGEFPRGVPVTINGLAQLYTDNKGRTFEYNGHFCIGGHYAHRMDADGQTMLICGGGHLWKAVLIPEDEDIG